MTEYLATDSGEYMYSSNLRALIAAWLADFQRNRDCSTEQIYRVVMLKVL